MKNLLIKILMIIGIIILPNKIVKAEEIGNPAFDDVNFYKCVVEAYNTKNSANKTIQDNLTDEELQTITSLDCNESDKQDIEKIKSAKGIEKLTELTKLDLSNNNDLNQIDITENTKLKTVQINNTKINRIDVSKNIMLDYLSVSGNNLSEIDVSKNFSLTTLQISRTNLSKIDVSNNTLLTDLYLSDNNLSEIDIAHNTELKRLELLNNNLSSLDVTKNKKLERLYIINSNLSEIDVSQNVKLKELYLFSNKINKIDVSKNLDLIGLRIEDNRLLSLNLLNNSNLINSTSYTLIFPQSRELTVYNDRKLNLKEYDNNLDPSKVVFTPIDGVTYDNTAGVFTFTKEVEKISYIYKTGLPISTGVSEDMQVNLTLNYSNENNPNEIEQDEYVDQKAESVQTGTITVGVITIVGILIGITYYIILKRRNKLFKL